VNEVCSACGASPLEAYRKVARAEDASLVATTTAYGAAPSDLVRCPVCGHRQVAEFPPDAALDEAYGDVDEGAYLEEETGQRATARRALERIERHASDGSSRRSIVDVGCWVGFLLSEAEERGWTAKGVEPSRFAAAFARDELGLDVTTGTLGSAQLPASEFDAAVLGDVIEHLNHPGTALDEIGEVVRPGGVLFLTLPDAGSLVARALGSRWWSVIPTHVQYFTRESITRLLQRHGYSVEWVGTAPKAFTVRYYLERLEGYSGPLARAAVWIAERLRLADRLVWPDFRDRMAVVARRVGA
jgi:SAM-dependent methyltransferase